MTDPARPYDGEPDDRPTDPGPDRRRAHQGQLTRASRVRLIGVPLAVIVGLGLAACSSPTNTPAISTSDRAQTVTSAPAALTPTPVGVPSPKQTASPQARKVTAAPSAPAAKPKAVHTTGATANPKPNRKVTAARKTMARSKSTPTRTSAPPPADTVTPGAFCSDQGAHGVTKRGKPEVCRTTTSDDRLRWRAA